MWLVHIAKARAPTARNMTLLSALIFTLEMKLTTHLYSRFGQVDLECDFLSHEDVWISCLLEQGFQDIQLGAGEGRALSPLLAWVT